MSKIILTMKSINMHSILTHSQTSESQNIRQMPQVFGWAMALIGLSAPLTSAATQPGAASTSGTGLVVVVNPVSYADGRPYPSYRLNAVDHGMLLEYGKGPNECDTMNAREALINCVDGTYYLYYDGAGAKGWVSCLAVSKDLKTWERKGPLLDFGPGGADSAAACSPWIIKDDNNLWHRYYLGTPNTTGGVDKIPIAPYLALHATSKSPGGPWAKFGSPWNTIEAPSDFQQLQVVTGDAFTRTVDGGGVWAALINTDDAPADHPLAQYLPRNIAAGDTLTVTFWRGRAKASPGGQAAAYIDVGGTKYSTTYDTTALDADSWKSYTLSQTIANAGNLSLGFYGTTKGGSWLDKISDVTVTPKSP